MAFLYHRAVLVAALAGLPCVAWAAAGAASPSQIGAWTTAFYAPPAPPPADAIPAPPRGVLPPEAQCIAAILDAERAAGITDHLLLAMGFTEAGRRTESRLFTVWPWTVNSEGRSRYFASRAEAIAFVRVEQDRGVRSIDVGCLQINLKWHPDAFADLETAFDPVANARYAAAFLTGLRRDHGSLDAAIGRYHSAQSERGAAYRERVVGNRRWVAHALGYLEALAAGPREPVRGGAAPVWTKAELGRLSFLSSLFADAPARPLLPDATP